MKLFRRILLGLSALIVAGCGDGGVQSPDFTPVLQELRITPAAATVAAGRTAPFAATAVWTLPPGSGAPTEERAATGVEWSTDNSNATIDSNGLATGVSAGSVLVRASLEGVDAVPAVLTVTAAELDSIAIDPPEPRTIALGGTQDYTAVGTFSDGTTAPVSVQWTSSDTSVATIPPGPTIAATASSAATGTTTIRATSGLLQDEVTLTVGPFVPRLVSLTVVPGSATQPAGRSQQFTVTGECTVAAFSAVTAPCAPTDPVTWASSDVSVATINAAGLASTLRPGSTLIAASSGSVTSPAATLTVTAPVVSELRVTPPADTVAIGGTTRFSVQAVLSNGNTGPVLVDWAPANGAIARVSPTSGAFTDATGLALGGTNIVATTTNAVGELITGQGILTVTDAVLTDLLRVETADGFPSGRTTPGRAREFVAIGRYSDGTEDVIDDANVVWTSDDNSIATVDANGFATGVVQGQVQIRATRVGSSPADTASAQLTVTDGVCTLPLLQSEGATATLVPPSLLCVGCTVSPLANVINGDGNDFATANTVLGLLGATVGMTVAPGPTPPYAVPFAGGGSAGFVIGKPAGTLLAAEVGSQVVVRTLLGGVIQESSAEIQTPLRVDLLGLQLLGGNSDTALVSVPTSLPYDAIQIIFDSGLASALSSVRVFQACATAQPPAP